MVAEHVHHAHRGNADAKEVGTLRHASTDEQSAIAATDDGEVGRTGVFLLDQILSSSDEVVEDVLLLHLRTRLVPSLAILAAATERSLGIDATALQERDAGSGERGIHRDIETAVGIEIDRVLAVEFQALLVGDEERYARTVLAGVEHLLGLILAELEVDLGHGIGLQRVGGAVILIDRPGLREGGKADEALLAVLVAADAGAANARKAYLLLHLAVEVIDIDVAAGVLLVAHIEFAADDVGAIDHVFALGDDGLPVFHRGLVDIHHHDLIHRRTVVGQQIDLVVDGGDGRVGVVHVGDHLRKLRVAVFQVADIEDVARAAARLIEELHRLLVVDRRTEEVHRLGGILEEELVLLLLRAEAVEVDLVGGVLARIGVALGFVIGAIEEAVSEPGGPRELSPLDVVGQYLERLRVHHIKLRPVAARTRDGVGQVFAVVGETDVAQGHRAVSRELVGVEEDASVLLLAQAVHLVEHTLVLKTVVLVEIPLARGLDIEGCSHLAVIGDFAQALQKFAAEGDLGQVVLCHLVLGLHPLHGGLRVVILQGAVGVGYFHTEILIHGVVRRRGGVG